MFKLIPKYITEQPSLPMPVGPTTQQQVIMHRPQLDHIDLDQFVPPRIGDIKKHAKLIGKFFKEKEADRPVEIDQDARRDRLRNPRPRVPNPPPESSFNRRQVNTEREINRMLDDLDRERGTV